ncbi:hypothetical protein RhiirA5_402328 [Rhizophagus irregularis]|uniref:Carbohydrate esterase family 16 protein n=2 Tax=Rhizophagus irregularis TaxID=588596 RepID=A0A2I1DXG7_9GLOM|nr:hypothetical protein RhiirA5_402328 [Rhizophagus irregularis]PKC70992.1 hypothetical protein RhiirA1_439108 [Rhizophagus irregularis]PKY14569.1 hypothetical protein RhiirB3_466166 [Rhizophagus irregularis]
MALNRYGYGHDIMAWLIRISLTMLHVFGDSTCDNGNTWRLSNFTYPPSDYFYKGRFSNGPTWVEYLADFCHIKDINYAYGGATSDNQFVKATSGFHSELIVPGIKQEVNNIYLKQITASNNSKPNFDRILYIVAHQGNDYLNQPSVNPRTVVGNLYEQWEVLANFGAKHILINKFFNLKYLPRPPKNGRLKYVIKNLLSRFITRLHNAAIDFYVWLFRMKHKNVKLYILPMDKIWEEFQKPSVKKELGITDYENPCVVREDKGNTTTYTVCSNPGQHFYWDYIHPSTKIHRYVGYKTYQIVTAKTGN